MTWAAIIPSRRDTKVLACVDSLRAIQPDMAPEQVVIVSDGLSQQVRAFLGAKWVDGKRPFVFSEAINAGARAAGDSDLFICGDDVVFASPGMVDHLQARSGGVAAIAPEVAGTCGQPEQRTNSTATRTNWLMFICVYIPREAWDVIGELDERFVGYGCDDLDWSLRARSYGPLVIDHDVSVIHDGPSTFRSLPDWRHLYEQNKQVFRDKWQGATP